MNSTGQDESCAISEPAEGRYYVRINAWRAFSGTSMTATAVPVPGTPSIDSITPGDGTLEVAFSPGSVTDQVDTYALTCVDQSSSRAASNFSEATASSPHYSMTTH